MENNKCFFDLSEGFWIVVFKYNWEEGLCYVGLGGNEEIIWKWEKWS